MTTLEADNISELPDDSSMLPPKPKLALILRSTTPSSARKYDDASLRESIKIGQGKPEKAVENSIDKPSQNEKTLQVIVDNELPPFDGGRKAWCFLLGACIFEGVMWGFPLTFGIFQSYYQRNPPFQNSQYVPVVGALVTGLPYLASPLICWIGTKYFKYRRHMIWGGVLTCILALVGSSFATEIWHLAVTQGVLYGIGIQVIYFSALSMLNEWFVERRGLAYGIMGGGSGICGLVLPFLMEKMLDNYGHANTLRGYALAIFLIMAPTYPFLQGRLPTSVDTKTDLQVNTGFLFTTRFLVAAFSNLFQGLAFFLPTLFISSYSIDIPLSKTEGAVILALLNVAQILGQIGLGHFADHFNVFILVFGSTICSALTVFLLWGFSNSFGCLIAFGLLFGLAAGGYSALWCRFATSLTGDPATSLFVFSTFEFGRGLGSVIAGPISSLLVLRDADASVYGIAKYSRLILFIGVTFLVSSIGGLGYFLEGTPVRFRLKS